MAIRKVVVLDKTTDLSGMHWPVPNKVRGLLAFFQLPLHVLANNDLHFISLYLLVQSPSTYSSLILSFSKGAPLVKPS